jgi:hypothetical protein
MSFHTQREEGDKENLAFCNLVGNLGINYGWLGGADCNGTALYPARAEWNPRFEQASIMNGLYDDMYYRTNTIRGNSQGKLGR